MNLTSSDSQSQLCGVVDVRCNANLCAPSVAAGRCQLFVGHEPPYAILYADKDGRHVRTWFSDCVPAENDSFEMCRLPWMYGFPKPAWTVHEEETDTQSRR